MLASVGVKAWSGKEDTTLLSMVDRRVKQVNVSTTMIWNKTPGSRVSKGERTHRGSKDPILQKKNIRLDILPRLALTLLLNNFGTQGSIRMKINIFIQL